MELFLVLIMSALAALVLYRVASSPILPDAMEDSPRPKLELHASPDGRSEVMRSRKDAEKIMALAARAFLRTQPRKNEPQSREA
jgi:hypothetical protein